MRFLQEWDAILLGLDAMVQSVCCPPFAKVREEWGTLGVVVRAKSYFAKRRTLYAIGRPITTMCTPNPKIRS